MPDIALLIGIKDDVKKVFRRAATLEDIAAWFTRAGSELYVPGNSLTLHFSDSACNLEVATVTL